MDTTPHADRLVLLTELICSFVMLLSGCYDFGHMVRQGKANYDVGKGEAMTRSERFGVIERMLLIRRSVRFVEMQERIGVSRATLHRGLQYMRDRMQVPIVHDRETGCYRIDRDAERYELPGMWFSAGEIHALLSMQQLLATLDPGGLLAGHAAPLRERLLSMLESGFDSAEEIARRIHIVSAAARHYAPQHFQIIAAALMERRRLNIGYRTRSNGITSRREISPQRLTHYRDNWYLDA